MTVAWVETRLRRLGFAYDARTLEKIRTPGGRAWFAEIVPTEGRSIAGRCGSLPVPVASKRTELDRNAIAAALAASDRLEPCADPACAFHAPPKPSEPMAPDYSPDAELWAGREG